MTEHYNYYQCKTCMAGPKDVPSRGPYRIATLKSASGFVAQALCPKCRKPMVLTGAGTASLPPPIEDVHLTINPVDPRDKVVHQGGGTDTTGRHVTFTVTFNEAQGRYLIEITCNGAEMVASLVANQIRSTEGSPEEWIVEPPFSIPGTHAWANLDIGTLERLKSLRYPTGAARLPAKAPLVLKLGAHYFGLIHLLAGHYNNTRRWIGTQNPTRVPDIAMPTAQQAEQIAAARAEQESYRTIQGIQRALGDALAVSAIQKVVQGPQGKYQIYGMAGGEPAQIVVRRNGNEFSIVTMYINDSFSRFGTLRQGETNLWTR